MVVSVRFEAEMDDYTSGLQDAVKAIQDWQTQTGVSAVNVTDKFEDAIRAVVKLGDATDRSVDEQKRALQGLGLSADEAEESLAAIKREGEGVGDGVTVSAGRAEDAVKRLGDESDDAGKKTAGINDSAAKAGEGVRSLGDIARDVLQGDFSSAVESAGSKLQGLGIAGTIAGTALTLTVGLWLKGLQDAQEKLDQTRDKATNLASTMYENQGQIPLADRVSELIDLLGSERIATNPFESILNGFLDLGTNIDTARDAARLAELPFSRVIRALTGADLGQTKEALEGVNDQLEKLGRDTETPLGELAGQQAALSSLKTELESVVEQSRLASDLYNSTDFLNKQAVEEMGKAWQDAAVDAAGYFTTTEDGATAFDWSVYLADSEAAVAAADEMKARLVGMPPEIKAEAERVFASEGAVAANAYTAAYEAASAADQVRFIAAAAANGEAAGAASAQGLVNAFGNPIVQATVRVQVDDSNWISWNPTTKVGRIVTSTGGTPGRAWE